MLAAVSPFSGMALWANQHLLFWLSFIPVATAWMSERGLARQDGERSRGHGHGNAQPSPRSVNDPHLMGSFAAICTGQVPVATVRRVSGAAVSTT